MNLNQLMHALESDDWQTRYNALDSIRWRTLSHAELENVLPLALASCAKSGECDKPRSIGVVLAKMSCDDQYTVALRWVEKDPSDMHFQVASNFLAGLWDPRWRQKPLAISHVDELLRLRRRLIDARIVNTGGGIIALLETFRDKSTSAEVMKRIADVLREVLTAPGITTESANWIRTLLSEHGFE